MPRTKKALAMAPSRDGWAEYRSGIAPGHAKFIDHNDVSFAGISVSIETSAPFMVRADLLAPQRWQIGTVSLSQVGPKLKKTYRKYWGQLYPKSFRYPVDLDYPELVECEIDWLSIITDGGAVDFNHLPYIRHWLGHFDPAYYQVSVPKNAKPEFLPEDPEEHPLNRPDLNYEWDESRAATWCRKTRVEITRRVTVTIPPAVVQRFLRALHASDVDRMTKRAGSHLGRRTNTALRTAIELLMLWNVPVVEPVVCALFVHTGRPVPSHVSFWNAVKAMGLVYKSQGKNQVLEGQKKFNWHLPEGAQEAWKDFANANIRLAERKGEPALMNRTEVCTIGAGYNEPCTV